MFLADTNIFLEVLLAGNKAETCKAFLDQNPGKIHLSDFSLHSIGVILFRQRKELVFKAFFEDVSINTRILFACQRKLLEASRNKATFQFGF